AIMNRYGAAGSYTYAGSCTSGIPVIKSGVSYVLTAGHCFDGANPTVVVNGMVNKGTVTADSSRTYIGAWSAYVDQPNFYGGYATTTTNTDSALINARSSGLVFTTAWPYETTAKAHLSGYQTDYPGKIVCTSGAFSGQVCNIQVRTVNTISCVGQPTIQDPRETACSIGASTGDQLDGRAAAGKGDSGGPVYSWSGSAIYAAGIISAGKHYDQQTGIDYTVPCDKYAFADRSCSRRVIWIAMPTIMKKWGLTVNTS
ncbi:MAG: hypothetical protein JWM93_810, partial [Frankiales bacterium]|nr:hypothetical protein [Frankiales bacterium]